MSAPEYVNQGPDLRAGGPLGHVLAWLQRTLAFHSAHPPHDVVWRHGRWRLGAQFSRPGGLPFLVVFIPRGRYAAENKGGQRWWSLRVGWRWDKNWGSGGYIADVIAKFRIDNTAGLSVVLALAIGVMGCGARSVPSPTVVRIVEPVEVKVPVLVERVPPPELLGPLTAPLPTFIAPADPNASSALTVEGERLFRAIVEDLLARIAAWEAWARSPVAP